MNTLADIVFGFVRGYLQWVAFGVMAVIAVSAVEQWWENWRARLERRRPRRVWSLLGDADDILRNPPRASSPPQTDMSRRVPEPHRRRAHRHTR